MLLPQSITESAEGNSVLMWKAALPLLNNRCVKTGPTVTTLMKQDKKMLPFRKTRSLKCSLNLVNLLGVVEAGQVLVDDGHQGYQIVDPDVAIHVDSGDELDESVAAVSMKRHDVAIMKEISHFVDAIFSFPHLLV